MLDDTDPHQVTRLLSEIADGNASARDELVRAVYDQLRKIAQVRMAAERSGHTLQATALVHEAYLRLMPNIATRDFKNHYDFYGAAAEAMRRILIEHARKRQTAKRGGHLEKVTISNVAELADTGDPETVIALNDAFVSLAKAHAELAEVVRLRFFAGLSLEETAEALGISVPTVQRRWRLARTLLFEALEKNPRPVG